MEKALGIRFANSAFSKPNFANLVFYEHASLGQYDFD